LMRQEWQGHVLSALESRRIPGRTERPLAYINMGHWGPWLIHRTGKLCRQLCSKMKQACCLGSLRQDTWTGILCIHNVACWPCFVIVCTGPFHWCWPDANNNVGPSFLGA
jgi:hypothetical protein